MAHIEQHRSIDLESPMLVEGLPGVGLVGKIAADHLVDQFDMVDVAACRCDGLPRVAVYEAGSHGVKSPVRIYADEERDLLVLQSDVPVSPGAATEFAGCVTDWLDAVDATPLYLSGLPGDKNDVPQMYGIGTGDGPELLAEHDIDAPPDRGMISGPTGALLARAEQHAIDGVGLVVQVNPQFPDPESARVLLQRGIGPIAGIDVDTELLVEQADRIADARERLAERMQQADEESTRAQPIGMYQ